MRKIKDEEQLIQSIMEFLETNEYMNYFRFKAYAFTNDKHKWLNLLETSSSLRVKIHQYTENRRRSLHFKSNYDYAPSVKACKKAEKEYKNRLQKKKEASLKNMEGAKINE